MNTSRLLTPTKSSSYFLFGARGTGKSTLLGQLFPKESHFWIDLLIPTTEGQYLLHPELLREKYLAYEKNERPKIIIIDEVQKAPKILDVVHSMIEEFKVKFVLTGSSARKLKASSANLLAGRAFQYSLYPFSLFEIEDQFELNTALSFGLLPKLFEFEDNEDKKDFLRSYAQKYLKEEIQMEQIVRDMVPFRKFLEVAAQSNAEIINYSKIGRTCGVDYKSVSRYFEVLSDTFLGFFLDSYNASMRVRQIASPKFYFFDTGVVRALNLSLNNNLESGSYSYGKLFETFIVMEVVKLNSYLKKDFRLSYLKSQSGPEIDLIIEEPNHTQWLLEIKSTKNVLEDDYKHLVHFSKDFPSAKKMVLSNDTNHRMIGDIEVIHFKEGLRKIFLI